MVRPGYKETDAGIIPEDWDALLVGDNLDFKNGLNKAKAYFGHGTPIINYMDVFGNSGLQASDIAGLVSVTSEEQSAYSARRGDLFFTRTSETVDEIGMSAVLLEDMDNAVFSGFVLRGRDKQSALALDIDFKKYCFHSPGVRKQIRSTASYTTRALTNGKLLSKVFVPTPSDPEEQKAIAEALSDVDGLIAGLEALIAKKRDLKTASMQQLLTGKTRLPGFGQGVRTKQSELGEIPEDWALKPLRELALAERGKFSARPRNDPKFFGGKYPFIQTGDVKAGSAFGVGFTQTLNQQGLAVSRLFASGTLFITIAANIGEVAIAREEVACPDSVVALTCKPNVDMLWLYQVLQPCKSRLEATASQNAQSNLNLEKLNPFLVVSPTEPDEQRAIGEILTDIDGAIFGLSAKWQKAQALKQGMMQELLTGRTRLI